ncbi:hypothetical protein D3C74_306640 [compost metagenome]
MLAASACEGASTNKFVITDRTIDVISTGISHRLRFIPHLPLIIERIRTPLPVNLHPSLQDYAAGKETGFPSKNYHVHVCAVKHK